MADLEQELESQDTDKSLLEGAFTEPKESQESESERARDERGRFASKEEPKPVEVKSEPVKTVEPPKEPEHRIPLAEHLAEREKRQNAERDARQFREQMAQLERRLSELQKPKEEPVDFFQDPNAALTQRLSPFEAQFAALQSNLTLRASRAENVATYGKEAVAEMEKAIGAAMQSGNPEMRELSLNMKQSDDPVGVAMNWHRKAKLLEETGGDILAYKQKMLDAALDDPAFLAKAIEKIKSQGGQSTKVANITKLPPSLNKATGSAPSGTGDDEFDDSDKGLLRQSLRK